MRWFKHMTFANRDEKLARIRDEFGLEGYGLFWIVLEIIAEKVDENNKTFVEFSPKFWKSLLQIPVKKFEKFLTFCEKLEIFSVTFSQNLIRVDCPNILKYRDEYTRKKAKKSGQCQDNVRTIYIDTETDTDTEIDNNGFTSKEVNLRASDGTTQKKQKNKENPNPNNPETLQVHEENNKNSEKNPEVSLKKSQNLEKKSKKLSTSPAVSCPHEKIISLYHEILPELPQVKVWGNSSKAHLRTRWREEPQRQSLKWWENFFYFVRKSDFLMGKKTEFRANLSWMVKATNFEKILNGQYHNHQNSAQIPQPDSRTYKNLLAVQQFLQNEKKVTFDYPT